MQIRIKFQDLEYYADLSKPLDLSIPIKDGQENPNCYYAKDVSFKTIKADGFIGSVEEGGSVNYKEVRLTPHGNGTHTETYGHLSSDVTATISDRVHQYHCIAQVISATLPKNAEGDSIVTLEAFKGKINSEVEAVIIRTLPNTEAKKTKKYSGTNPPFLHNEVTEYLRQIGIKHLLVDLPSVDKEVDGGKLLAHRNFWGLPNAVRKECTITELIYVDNNIADGIYFLNLQTLNLVLDASPSRPVIYKLDLV